MASTIDFSHSLYSTEVVKQTIQLYQSLAEFSVSEGENCIEVTIDNIHPDFSTVLIDAFCNHVLNETIILYRREQGGTV